MTQRQMCQYDKTSNILIKKGFLKKFRPIRLHRRPGPNKLSKEDSKLHVLFKYASWTWLDLTGRRSEAAQSGDEHPLVLNQSSDELHTSHSCLHLKIAFRAPEHRKTSRVRFVCVARLND